MSDKRWRWMCISTALVMSVAMAAPAAAPEVASLRQQIAVQKKLAESGLDRLDRAEGRLMEAWTRVQRSGNDFYKAMDQGEGLQSLSPRDEDLRAAESELLMGVFETQQIRRSLLETVALMEQLNEQLKVLRGNSGLEEDHVSGRWKVTMEPGGNEGELVLVLNGTLVQGRYEFDGGFRGSLRGTLVSNRIRLERIDSQMGFVAVYYGALRVHGDDARLEGKWEATRLATGLPSGGSWVADKIREDESNP